MQKIAFFTPKRYKNGSQTEVRAKTVLLFGFELFLLLFTMDYLSDAWGLPCCYAICHVASLPLALRLKYLSQNKIIIRKITIFVPDLETIKTKCSKIE